MSSGILYDSDEGRAICGALSAILTGRAYATSAEIAAKSGAFPAIGRTRKRCCASSAIISAPLTRAGAYEKLSVAPTPLDHASSQAGPEWRSSARPRAPRG